jgi:glutamine synthetase
MDTQQKNDEKIPKILDIIKKKKVIFIRLQFLDIFGVPKNIIIPSSRLEEVFHDGISFDGSSIDGYATIDESDKIAKPDPHSFVIIPTSIEEKKTAKLNCDIYNPNSKRFVGDTKYVLEKTIKKADDLGFNFYVGPECEFFLFNNENNKYQMIPNDSAGYFDLSHMDVAEGVRADVSLALKEFGINTFTSHHEVANGQHEINFDYSDALTTADRVITLKYVTKIIAMKHNLYASFMPKPIYGVAGSGMHTHMSLFSKSNKNAFYDPNDKHYLSKTAKYFIGGILKNINEICAILNPTVNSFKRLVPGYEAPTYISWAHSNRSALIRIPLKKSNSTRCELRNPDLSGNPYLQFAVMLEAGLDGITNKIEPPKLIEQNIYSLSESERKNMNINQLPDNLGHSISIMERSEFINKLLGNHIFKNFIHVKKQEWENYRKHVTGWEIEKYYDKL